ncbi:multidrug ABC transporter ATPase [Burkholderia vietnamiensis]|uniref:hypothetical protein n=1 Tax=Burkholderia vietnamiensis TaxID=60552 RepID=UPI00076C15C7|nr:multidrug ABC transporter ATPase [Burkholderia vietnamiensis]KVE96382.1 multidrug ABC transporter ATPase [Burkholderia vietnamiensis]MBR7976820.1 multidrug ABC transporter ATPase [Burkholderia vietnamiensis]
MLVKLAHSWKILGLASLLGLAITPSAYADDAQSCDSGIIPAVARWAGITGNLVSWNEPDGLIAAAACKIMPGASNTTIAVVAFDTNHEGPNPDQGTKIQVVALVEAGRVVAANRSIIEEDALTAVGSYRVDTAPYVLSPEVRAFGVVFTSGARGPSCPDVSAEDELTLWVREGDHLRPILGTNLAGWITVDELTCGNGMIGARTESAHMTIAVEKTTSHGFANLSLTAHITQTELKADGFVDTGKRIRRTVLKYDGKSYGTDMFRNFWYPPTCPICSRGH